MSVKLIWTCDGCLAVASPPESNTWVSLITRGADVQRKWDICNTCLTDAFIPTLGPGLPPLEADRDE